MRCANDKRLNSRRPGSEVVIGFCQERQARERCHLEALKSTEKLRLARAQGAVLKERLRRFEEAQLRYPSRCRPPERLSSEEQSEPEAEAVDLELRPRNEPRAVRQELVRGSDVSDLCGRKGLWGDIPIGNIGVWRDETAVSAAFLLHVSAAV